METAFDLPPHRPHPNENDGFVNLGDARRILARFSGSFPASLPPSRPNSSATSGSRRMLTRFSVSSPAWLRPSGPNNSATSGSPSVGVSGTGRVFLHETNEMVENEHGYMEVSASESKMGFWIVWMQGPPGPPYERGVFLLYVDIGEKYPTKASEAKFVTPILHPNVMKQGLICHPILGRDWDGRLRIYLALQQLWGMLMLMEASLVKHFASRTRPGVPPKFQQTSFSSRTAPTDSGGRLAQRQTYNEAVKAARQRRNGKMKEVFDLALIGREGV